MDQADELIGAEGEWVKTGPTRAVKHIPFCPHARRLWATPPFCIRLGVVMGQAAFRAYAPGTPADYAILLALSRGDPCCEYVVSPGPDDSREELPGPAASQQGIVRRLLCACGLK